MTTPTIKTAQEISQVFISTLEAQLSQTVPLWPKAFNRLIAKVLGLAFVVLFQFSEFIALQLFITTASDKDLTIGGITINPLNEWGRIIGLTRNTGQRWQGTTTVTVLTQTGSIPSGTQMLNANTGELYLTIGETLLDAATVTPTVRAVNYSAAADLDVGDTISFVSAPATVEKDTTIATDDVSGTDPEDTETWRSRQLDWWASRPQGGAYADYREWGQEVTGVENIYPFSGGTPSIPTSGPGQVDIYVEASDTTDGIAGTTLLAEVKESIEQTAATGLADRRPVNVYVNTASIFRITVDATVSSLVVDDEAGVQADITESLTSYMLSRENYIDGLSILPRKDVISQAEAAGIVGRVVAANGGTVGSVTLSSGANTLLIEGQKAKIGTVTYS